MAKPRIRSLIHALVQSGITDKNEIRRILLEQGRLVDEAVLDKHLARKVAEVTAIKIYCDGCCEPNPSSNMGIGVYSDCGIEIARRLDQWGTNNVAECLAAIAALEEAERRGLRNILLLSDSALVVNWVRGDYALQSQTARQHVPTIRQLLQRVGGRIKWIPGTENLADRLSRQLVEAPPSRDEDMLDYVIRTPMERLKFRDFARLKSGRNDMSNLRLPQLRRLVPDHAAVDAVFEKDAQRASCLRWVLRGLPLDKAIRKVETDAEIAASAIEAHRERRADSDGDY